MMLIGFATWSAFGSGPPTPWPVLPLIAGGSIFAAAALAAVAALIVRARPPKSSPSRRGVMGMLIMVTAMTLETVGTQLADWRHIHRVVSGASFALVISGLAAFLAAHRRPSSERLTP
jgi:hypothetical protein